MNLPKSVTIRDVGPRDGLQNEKQLIAAADKIALIDSLTAAGVSSIEFTSFVSPKWVPQMADAEEVAKGITRRKGVSYQVLVLNPKGFERAQNTQIDGVNLVVAASQTMNEKNMNTTTEAALDYYVPVVAEAKEKGYRLAGYVSTACYCPFEGYVAPEKVVEIARRWDELGVYEIVLADTIGGGNPQQVAAITEAVAKYIPLERIGWHFHDTRGMALANALAAAQVGVSRFDASIGGLGGCPFAPGASGNATTEDLVFMFEEMGVSTGINVDALLECARQAERLVGRPLPGHVKGAKPLKRG
jgi:hydroxymethylglutaryl-CoA lyase